VAGSSRAVMQAGLVVANAHHPRPPSFILPIDSRYSIYSLYEFEFA